MAAVSLNLIMGFGGMVSFGHAAYIGIGGYVVGILAHEGVRSGFVQWPLALAALGPVRARHRRAQPAHPRRLLHHDHARLRADDLLRGGRPRPLRRRRRPHHLPPQPVRRPRRSRQQDRVLLPVPGAAARLRLSGLAARQLALRSRHPGLALQRPAHERHRLPDLPLPADRLRHRRRHLRPVRRAARQPHRLHQPGDDALDALRRPDRHGGAGRHGQRVRPGARRARAAAARGGAAQHHRPVRASSSRARTWRPRASTGS